MVAWLPDNRVVAAVDVNVLDANGAGGHLKDNLRAELVSARPASAVNKTSSLMLEISLLPSSADNTGASIIAFASAAIRSSLVTVAHVYSPSSSRADPDLQRAEEAEPSLVTLVSAGAIG